MIQEAKEAEQKSIQDPNKKPESKQNMPKIPNAVKEKLSSPRRRPPPNR